jgi:hypothetical protein
MAAGSTISWFWFRDYHEVIPRELQGKKYKPGMREAKVERLCPSGLRVTTSSAA